MVKSLFVPKKFGTYADTFLMLGLAQLAEAALKNTNFPTEMLLKDAGTHYQLELKAEANLQAISELTYSDPFPIVFGKKTDISKFYEWQITSFDVVENSERRKRFRDYQFQNRKSKNAADDAPDPPDSRTQNGAILTSMRHDRNHNDLLFQFGELREHYGVLIATILVEFSQLKDNQIERIYQQFEEKTGNKLPTDNSAVKVYFPTSVQGVSAIKADKNTFSSQKIDGLSLWLIAGGFFQLGLAERVKVADSVYDWRVVALEPYQITLDQYRSVLKNLRVYNPPGGGHGIARFDAELVLKFSQELLNYHPAKEQTESTQKRRFRRSIKEFVGGFRGTHFGSKGQVYGVKEIFSLGLPFWISPENKAELLDYLEVLNEHLGVIYSLSAEKGHSELLAAYRDFITGSHLRNFFKFQVIYADYVVKRLADTSVDNPRLFSVKGLNTMTKKDVDFAKITKDPSFLRIAKAINQATVYAGKIQTKDGSKELDWQRQYGLAQLLGSQSGSKRDFICAIAEFLGKYEHENLRLTEQYIREGKRLMRVQPTKEDLDRLIELIDEFDAVLVANLLIAYGYAKWTKAKDESSEKTGDENVDTDELEDE